MKRARRNNRVTANLYDILSFPSADDSVSPAVPFRDNIKTFLSCHARVTFLPSLFPSLLTWQILFRIGDLVLDGPGISPVVLALDIVEEDVTKSPRSVYCNQCRVAGWSGHPVCKKRYHFIIRASSSSPADGYQRSCSRCGNWWLHVSSESRCMWCDPADDIEEWVYSQFEDNTHLLHGVVHSNGFGHLILVNGREGGSTVLTGSDIMNFWDRLCVTLAVRKVSVMDVSRKYGMEYRLLNAITKGHSCLIHESNGSLTFKTALNNFKPAANILCAWTRDDAERVQQAMIKVLAAASGKANWVTRHALKGVMCKTASPELLDYCLKHLGGKLAAGGMAVQARCNHPNSFDLEFRLEPLSSKHNGNGLDSNQPSKEHVIGDLKFLFDSLVHPETMVNYRPLVTREDVIDSATKLLDCKQFMKDYNRPSKQMADNPFAIQLWCHVEFSEHLKEDPAIPPELIVLPSNGTVADLKTEATKTFQEVYAMLNRFEACELLDYGSLEDSITIKFLVGQSGTVRIKGTCPSKHALRHFRMEKGQEKLDSGLHVWS
ncbi:PHD FINGER PLANT-LIKE PROTEIN [Salix purpurea]|uniref:PHD FINGER PLANT-LIKE PROTEIN n=1 Tax=Salix purpurea TaxID=77065 RepID=A0A9Q0WAC6_SALPP|nr:PHD FINGER PLANT-LIKE PROTEIN [Salix purpurea]